MGKVAATSASSALPFPIVVCSARTNCPDSVSKFREKSKYLATLSYLRICLASRNYTLIFIMSNKGVPSVGTLDKPENIHDVLKQDRGDDCTPCRVVG